MLRALLNQMWAMRRRGRRLLKDERAGRMQAPACAMPALTPPPAEPAAGSAESGGHVRRGLGKSAGGPARVSLG